jgi:uncharacterized metal-binding protein YceD (DUF177 family)
MKNQSNSQNQSREVTEENDQILSWYISKTDFIGKKEYKFNNNASKEQLTKIANFLKIFELLHFSLHGSIFPEYKKGLTFKLAANLSATTVQKCVVTLQPIKKKIHLPIERWFFQVTNDNNKIDTGLNPIEQEMEGFKNKISLEDIALEELVLNLPDYPRKPNAKFSGITVTRKGISEFQKSDLKPFSVLSVLKNKSSPG